MRTRPHDIEAIKEYVQLFAWLSIGCEESAKSMMGILHLLSLAIAVYMGISAKSFLAGAIVWIVLMAGLAVLDALARGRYLGLVLGLLVGNFLFDDADGG